jgi:hypothetical protein
MQQIEAVLVEHRCGLRPGQAIVEGLGFGRVMVGMRAILTFFETRASVVV